MSTQTNTIKYKEVWRNAGGKFAKAPQPVKAVKPEAPIKPEANTLPALVLIGGSALVVAVAFWQVTVTVLLLTSTAYALRWHLKRERIIINHYGG